MVIPILNRAKKCLYKMSQELEITFLKLWVIRLPEIKRDVSHSNISENLSQDEIFLLTNLTFDLHYSLLIR